jgi:hypothetical protein
VVTLVSAVGRRPDWTGERGGAVWNAILSLPRAIRAMVCRMDASISVWYPCHRHEGISGRARRPEIAAASSE